MNYRPEIDGLRAIAVVAVVLYHAQIVVFGGDWFRGGFIGVDIFFVISGYLITRIILHEVEEEGYFGFLKFYNRRARRILPVLLVVIATCLLFSWQKLLPLALVDFSKSALSAIGFGSNFFFYFSTTEYGADSALLKPLLHTWSLGVEEQFYVVAPVLILLIWKSARSFTFFLLIGMLLTSIQFAEMMSSQNKELNFFLPFSRFWELFVGSVLAYVELKFGRLKSPFLAQTLPPLGLLLVIYSIIFFNSDTPHPGYQTLIPVIGVALIIAAGSSNDFTGRVLATKPFVGLGLISYSLYLWHFPIFAFNRLGLNQASNKDKLEWIALALVISIISYFAIEQPFRSKKWINNKIFYTLTALLLSALISINLGIIQNDGFKNRLPAVLMKGEFDRPVWFGLKQGDEHCFDRKTEFCRIISDAATTTIYALGDSHLASLSLEIVDAIGDEYNYVAANAGACPVALGVDFHDQNGTLQTCSHAFQVKRLGQITNRPSIVLVGGRLPHYLDNYAGRFKSTDGDVEISEAIFNGVNHLINQGHHIILIYPIPEAVIDDNTGKPINVPHAIYQKFKIAQASNDLASILELLNLNTLSSSYEFYVERSKSSFQLLDSIKSPNLYRVYPHELFCNTLIENKCITFDNDHVYYADGNHPSQEGARLIVYSIFKQIQIANEAISTSKNLRPD